MRGPTTQIPAPNQQHHRENVWTTPTSRQMSGRSPRDASNTLATACEKTYSNLDNISVQVKGRPWYSLSRQPLPVSPHVTHHLGIWLQNIPILLLCMSRAFAHSIYVFALSSLFAQIKTHRSLVNTVSRHQVSCVRQLIWTKSVTVAHSFNDCYCVEAVTCRDTWIYPSLHGMIEQARVLNPTLEASLLLIDEQIHRLIQLHI